MQQHALRMSESVYEACNFAVGDHVLVLAKTIALAKSAIVCLPDQASVCLPEDSGVEFISLLGQRS